jgi:hypothetical protein
VPERVTIKIYLETHCGPTFLMLTDDYHWIRTAGTDTEPYTSAVTILRDDTDAEEFEGVQADLPELLRHRDKLLALDLPTVDVAEYNLWDIHPIAALIEVAEQLGLAQPG